jgi:hypothetical protein
MKALGRVVPVKGTERHSTREVNPCCVKLKLTGKSPLLRELTFEFRSVILMDGGIDSPADEVVVLIHGVQVAGRVPPIEREKAR